MRRLGFSVAGCLVFFLSGCGGGVQPVVCGRNAAKNSPSSVSLVQVANCSGTPASSLPKYDQITEQFLDEPLRHPTDNLAGNVVWGTRYYLESLLTAYEATRNPKYIASFLDSGQWVLNLVQTITIVDAPDPGQPWPAGSGPLLAVTGWPTWGGMFSVPAMVPTQSGEPALYAQNLSTAVYFQVTQQSDGGLQLAWTDSSDNILEAHTVQSMADLNAVASLPLNWGQSQSAGRIKPTGAGLPVPGQYPVYVPEKTVWNTEEAGGILLPFAHFLLLAKENPGLVDEAIQAEWTDKIRMIAAGYEDDFISDGNGGLRLHNPQWLPNTTAALDAPMDYISAEATFRLFLYELTADPDQLAIVTGLLQHQANYHLSVGPQGWLLLELWPDFVPWSNASQAPAGNVWDSFEFDPTTPSPNTDGGFFAELLHYAKLFSLQFCMMDSINGTHRAAVQQYLLLAPGSVNASQPLVRGYYPGANSKSSDPITPSDDLFAGSGFLTSEVATQSTVDANWNWMLKYGQALQGSSGYFLRAWARSEAAELNRCNYTQ